MDLSTYTQEISAALDYLSHVISRLIGKMNNFIKWNLSIYVDVRLISYKNRFKTGYTPRCWSLARERQWQLDKAILGPDRCQRYPRRDR